ncbi:MAG: diguanylate cyclase [Gemmatimonadaceae bacterium]
MTAPHSSPDTARVLSSLARVMPLAGGEDVRALVVALGELAREALGVPTAVVVSAEEADEWAMRPGEPGTKVVALRLQNSQWTLVVAGSPAAVEAEDESVQAVIAVAGAALAHHETLVAQRREAALGRAARTLHQSLDASTLLGRICGEAALLVGADVATVLRADDDALVVEAVHGADPELVGLRISAADAGAAARARDTQQPIREGDVADAPDGSPWAGTKATIAVPIDWGGRLPGVLSVAYRDPANPAHERATTLAAFAELAGAAFANASAHTGLALSARTDPLTGCLNHAALHDGLRREVERAERADDAVLSLILLDLDRLRDAREDVDNPVVDEILRRAGHALRSTTRLYDLAARYGGTEFALITIEADEHQACEIAARAVGRLTTALVDLEEGGVGSATAGVAQWTAGMTAGDLVARADRVLMYAKRSGRRDEVLTEADLPPTFAPGRARRRDRPLPPSPAAAGWTPAAADAAEPVRARARQLARANRFGARLGALRTVDDVVHQATVALREEFDYTAGGVVRTGSDAPPAGGLGVAIEADGEQWGTLWASSDEPMGDADARLLEMIAAHVGAAVAAAARQEELERILLGAAAALAEADGSDDTRTAVAVGRRLGMGDAALRDLALAVLLRGEPASTAADALDGARALLLHAREHWDGTGPGGAAGDAIPLAARVLAALEEPNAVDGSDTRFDPAVVAAVRAERAARHA